MKIVSRIIKIFLYFIIPISVITVLAISYISMCNLAFPTDRAFEKGKKLSVIAKKLRVELLKDKNLKKVNFNAKDGLKLVGYFVRRPNAKANLLLCHGYLSCKEQMSHFLNIFPDYNVLMFDFRANGQSEGKYRTMGCHEYKDVIAAMDCFREQTKQQDLSQKLPMIILGVSMGGASTIKALEFEPNLCDALIIDSAFSNLTDVINRAFRGVSGLPCFPFVFVTKAMTSYVANCDFNAMCPVDSLKFNKKPIFFIHSCVDNVIAPNDSLLMYSKCLNEKKRIWIAPPCGHGKISERFAGIYKRKVDSFLKDVLA